MLINDLKAWQMVNHFYKNNLITTKIGLCHSLRNVKWWSATPLDSFFPRCYDITDGKEMEDFKMDFRVCKSESVVKKFVKKKEVQNVEKLLIALHISLKRLKDIDDVLDDPDLATLVSEEEW